MERNINVNGRELNFAATYDGDNQYNVQVRSGEKIVTAFTIAAESEPQVFEPAVAHVKADIELGNIKV